MHGTRPDQRTNLLTTPREASNSDAPRLVMLDKARFSDNSVLAGGGTSRGGDGLPGAGNLLTLPQVLPLSSRPGHVKAASGSIPDQPSLRPIQMFSLLIPFRA